MGERREAQSPLLAAGWQGRWCTLLSLFVLPGGANMIVLVQSESSCDHCGKVYNPMWGDRFWSGSWACSAPDTCEGGGGVHETLCNDCHRTLVRES